MLIEAEDRDFADLIAGGPVHGLAVAPGGIETDAILTMLRGLAAQVRSRFRPAAWIIVENHLVVGLCSALGPAEAGELKIGYGIAASQRHRGIAARAIADVVIFAAADPRIIAITAETAVDNIASQGVLVHNGFTTTGTRVDDADGPLLCWRRDVAS